MGFNGSIWHSLYILVPLGLLVYVIAFSTLGGRWYHFDPRHFNDSLDGDFEPHAKRYQDLAKLVITLSAAAIGFLIHAAISSDPQTVRLRATVPIVVGFFGASIA